MGAWGRGSFENDDALDWLDEFEGGGLPAIDAAFSQILELADDDYLEAPEASVGVAAAEFVAAATDGLRTSLPESTHQAFARHQPELLGKPPLKKDALTVVERVLRQSELRELWEESAKGALWVGDIEGLAARLR
jgi:Domain of unknown function (DUF4259)